MQVKNSKFVSSYTDKLPTFTAPEFAMVGRSNVGKSSLINNILNCSIAKTSSVPGRTRLINYFSVNSDQFFLVDLPGYGYASAEKTVQNDWKKVTENYFKNTKNLKCVLFLLDIRRDLSEDDKIMYNYLVYYNIPFTVIATKCDKFSKAEMYRAKTKLAGQLKIGIENIILSSSTKKFGREEILKRIEQFL